MAASLPYVSADEFRHAVTMTDAIDALRVCFAAAPSHVERQQVTAGSAEMLVMPAATDDAAGVKLVTIQPDNPSRGMPIIQAVYVLFETVSGRPIATFDGTALTSLRTPAVSAVATEQLARADVRTLGLIGTGPQAVGHLEAMLCVRPDIDRVIVAGRTAGHLEVVAVQLQSFGLPVAVGSYDDAAGCDIVCTLTRATEPLFAAPAVRPGAHLNLVGSYRLDMREVDDWLVARSAVYVDEINAAHHEAGELAHAVQSGEWSWESVAGDLADLAAGRCARRSADEITMFKSSGLAVQDLAVVQLAARVLGLL